MATVSNHYILILCGGSGPRLWPLSRANKPKQFLKLVSNHTLLKDTFLRAKKIVDRDHIFVISQEKYLSLVKDDLKNIVIEKNIISEPEKKNTALAILYGSTLISKVNPTAVITSFPADHYIGDLSAFIKTIKKAAEVATSTHSIVTLGIKPTSPSTSYGYLLVDQPHHKVYHLKNFIEKPPLSIAEKLLRSGRSFWNSGIYTFNAQTMFLEYQHHAPQYFSIYQKFLEKNPDISKIYANSPDHSIDIAISEKSKNIVAIQADFAWSDIGEWKSIYQQLSAHKDNIVSLDKNTEFVSIDSKKCLVCGQRNKLIGLVEVNNLAIIDTPDALLVCNIAYNGSYQVRNLVSKIVTDPNLKKYFLSKNDQ